MDTLSDLALQSIELGVRGNVEGPRLAAGERSHGEEGLGSGERMQTERGEVHGAKVEVEDVLV